MVFSEDWGRGDLAREDPMCSGSLWNPFWPPDSGKFVRQISKEVLVDLGSRPPQSMQSVVVDSEVVGHLVHDRDAYFANDIFPGFAGSKGRIFEDCDLVGERSCAPA